MSRRERSQRQHAHFPSPLWLVIGVLAIALTTSLFINFSGQSAAATTQSQHFADETAVENVVLTAFSAPERAVVLPNTPVSFGATKLTAKMAAVAPAIAMAETQAQNLFYNIYAPNCDSCKSLVANTYKSLEGQARGRYRALGWGVRDVQWRQVLINGQSASVTMSATLWSKLQYLDQFGNLHTVIPTEGLVKIYTLDKINGRWLVSNEVQDDAAASSLPVNNVKPNGKTGAPPANQQTPANKMKPQKQK